MIVRAQYEDIPALVDYTIKAHGESTYADVPFDKRSCMGMFATHIQERSCRVWFSEDGGKVHGFLIAAKLPMEWNSRYFYATTILYVADKNGGYLFNRFHHWAKRQKRVKRILFGESQGPSVAGKLCDRLGFENVGSCYSLRVNDVICEESF